MEPVQKRGSLAVYLAIAFVFGLGLASSLEWSGRGQTTATAASVLPVFLQGAPPSVQAQVQNATELSDAFIAIAANVTPAVVRITAERAASPERRGARDFFGLPPDAGRGQQPRPQLAGGSGFLVSSDGYILTNTHVVEGADLIQVTLVDKRTFEARVVGLDPTTDVAVIKIEGTDLPAAHLADSEDARVGEWVLAIGNPGFSEASTLDFTVTGGIISAKGRPLYIINREPDNPAGRYAIEDFLQTDAVINPGNSGGPLVNLRGEVVGINTAIASGTGFYQGYGFAIPSNLARRVMTDLVQYGHVRRALLGIVIGEVTVEDAEVYSLPAISGVRVDDFSRDFESPARQAGLDRHDVIVAVNDEPVERVGQLQRVIAQHRPGETVEVTVIRFGEARRLRVRLAEAPIPEAPVRRPDRVAVVRQDQLGISVADATPTLAREHSLRQAGGVVITDVLDLSAAARKGVDAGDRVLTINGTQVRTARDAEALLRGVPSGRIVSLLLESRDGSTRIANIRVP